MHAHFFPASIKLTYVRWWTNVEFDLVLFTFTRWLTIVCFWDFAGLFDEMLIYVMLAK